MQYGYVFYSASCSFCFDLMKLMEKHELNKIFKYQSVDGMDAAQFDKLPFKEVPAILLISSGKNQSIFQSNDAFVWVKNFLVNRRQLSIQSAFSIQNAESSRKLIQRENTIDRFKNGVGSYCPDEQTGISDMYALCNENENHALAKAFKEYNKHDLSNDNIVTIPIGDMTKYKKKEGLDAVYGNDLKKAITNVELSRKKQEDEIKLVMEQNTINQFLQNSNM